MGQPLVSRFSGNVKKSAVQCAHDRYTDQPASLHNSPSNHKGNAFFGLFHVDIRKDDADSGSRCHQYCQKWIENCYGTAKDKAAEQSQYDMMASEHGRSFRGLSGSLGCNWQFHYKFSGILLLCEPDKISIG